MRFLLGLLLICTTLFSQNLENEFADEFSQPKKSVDTFKSYNEFMTNVNDKIYVYLLTPVAKGYNTVIPQGFRVGVSNIFENLKFPISFINNLLQLKFKNSFTELERFVLNSTLGIAGFNDIAKTQFNLQAKKEDFGQTLGVYGFNNTPHIVLPILGPSNLRDIFGMSGDYLADSLSYIHGRGNLLANDEEALIAKGYRALNSYSFEYKTYENIKKDSINLYVLLKNAYEQKRDREIKE